VDGGQPLRRDEPVATSRLKPFAIPKQAVWKAWLRVKANRGAAGVDEQSLAAFEVDLRANLYKLWNRMSSGSYFPPPVRAVPIPKRDGSGERILGVPTVADRIAQTVVADYLVQRGGTDIPSGQLRVPAGAGRVGRGSGVPGALLEVRLGH